MEVRSWITGRRGISLPFSDSCDVLAVNGEAAATLLRRTIAHGRGHGWKSVEWRGPRASAEIAAPSRFVEHRLDLRPGESTLFAQCAPSTRRAIRRGQREDLDVQFTQDISSVRIFYRLHCHTRRRLGLPPQPFRFFQALHRHVLEPGYGWTAIARHQEVPIAAAIFVQFGSTIHYKFSASNRSYQQLRGNNAVMWAAITRFVKEGFQTLDLGRTARSDAGLRRYKLGWGARENPLPYAKYDLVRSRFMNTGDLSVGWHNRVFTNLPAAVGRLIGRLVYRHIA